MQQLAAVEGGGAPDYTGRNQGTGERGICTSTWPLSAARRNHDKAAAASLGAPARNTSRSRCQREQSGFQLLRFPVRPMTHRAAVSKLVCHAMYHRFRAAPQEAHRRLKGRTGAVSMLSDLRGPARRRGCRSPTHRVSTHRASRGSALAAACLQRQV